MSVPYTFASATSNLPLAELDSNFATPITIGTTPVALGNTATSISGLSLVAPDLGTPASGDFSSGTFTWPTFNQNTTGTAGNVTGVVAIANGGTGATTLAGANIATTNAANTFGFTSTFVSSSTAFNAVFDGTPAQSAIVAPSSINTFSTFYVI